MTKPIITTTMLLLLATAPAAAQQNIAGGRVTANGVKAVKQGDNVTLSMDLVLDKLSLKPNKGLVMTPMIINGADTLKMPAIEVMGRKRYIYYQRNGATATAKPAIVERRRNGEAQTLHYEQTADYARWMRNGQIAMGLGDCGCQQDLLGQGVTDPVASTGLFGGPWNLNFAYVQPEAEGVKHRAESGSAKLNFVLDKYDIRERFGNNAAELAKIRRTIDLVRNDKDVTITGIKLHGYASPDGTYKHNEKLAANRTEALRRYLKNYYDKLPEDLFTATSTAEDWEGVRRLVDESDLKDRQALLDIIDDPNLTPDEKDRRFAQKHGAVYRSSFLKDIYPPLRRTDYEVTYNVRNFNLEEARQIIKTAPQKLSQNEMYMVANSYEKGSEEFNHVFDVAVRMFPDDKLANLNAALAALDRGDAVGAEKFLQKAGDSAEADNARGILAVKKEDFASARTHFAKAADKGLQAARHNLDELEKHGE